MYIVAEGQTPDDSIYIGFLVAGLYTNAFIVYEIYICLSCSNQMKHHNCKFITQIPSIVYKSNQILIWTSSLCLLRMLFKAPSLLRVIIQA